MDEYRIFNFGGKMLMKWCEPRGPEQRIIGFAILEGLILVTIIFMVKSVKLNGQPIKDFPFSLLIIIYVSFFIFGFVITPTVRLRELCVTRRAGKYLNRSNYSEIERAIVQHQSDDHNKAHITDLTARMFAAIVQNQNYNNHKVSIIKFKLKNKPKSFWTNGFKVREIIVPPNVNLEQVMQILRDKGVNVIERQLRS
jgi:hypothetical protein